MKNIWIKRTVGIVMCVVLCGVIAWAQKNGDTEKGITLADLGVTEAQKTQIEEMWELKRQKQIQALDAWKILNRLAKDSLAEEADIQEMLHQFRAKRKELQARIEETEDVLIQTLPTRAQLHLTLLGVLDNGLPPRIAKSRTQKKDAGETTSTPSDEQAK